MPQEDCTKLQVRLCTKAEHQVKYNRYKMRKPTINCVNMVLFQNINMYTSIMNEWYDLNYNNSISDTLIYKKISNNAELHQAEELKTKAKSILL